MIGVPMPDPRDEITTKLNRALDDFFGSGKHVQHIPSGVSAEVPMFGATPHSKKLRALRDKDAPKVKALAKAGKTASATATALEMRISRVKLIAQEHGITFAEK
jgi:hypothetical protein